jgi:hypothetical protein
MLASMHRCFEIINALAPACTNKDDATRALPLLGESYCHHAYNEQLLKAIEQLLKAGASLETEGSSSRPSLWELSNALNNEEGNKFKDLLIKYGVFNYLG